jgi:hypothetical protein
VIDQREVDDILCNLSDRERTTGSSTAASDPGALSFRGELPWVPTVQNPTSVIIRLGNRFMLLRGASPNVFLPAWVKSVLKAIVPLFRLQPNWDSYRAMALDPKTVKSALEILFSVMSYDSPPPCVVPTVSGGLQFEWHVGGIDLEIAVSRPGEGRFIFEDQSGSEIEGELPAEVPRLADLVSGLPK